MASVRIRRSSAVISSASISFNPRPKRCGASRLSGGHHVASSAGGSARTAMAAGTIVPRPAPIAIVVLMSPSRPAPRALLLESRELPLEQLSTATDRAERIAADEERRRARRRPVAATRAHLLGERLVDASFATFGACVWSIIWPDAGGPTTARPTKSRDPCNE